MMNKDTAIYPDYTEYSVYKELITLSENAGIKIEYTEKQGYAIGGAKSHEYETPVINMMINHDYGTFEYASFVLAHEIAHTLIDGFYGEGTHHFYSDTEHIHRFIEADADKVGAALYSLAEMTSTYKAESACRAIIGTTKREDTNK